MSKMLDKILKNSTSKLTSLMSASKMFNDVDETTTEVYGLNIALSGKLDGGLKSGMLTIAGPSRHFKSLFSLIIAAAYMKKNPEAIMIFYDSEFGSGKAYFDSVGIDPDRVVHIPVQNLEELKFDLMNQLQTFERGDKVIIYIDSIGNLASLKEIEDAISEKSVADMTRAKFLKGLYRMVTPYLRIKDIPLIQVGHIYMTQELYPKPILSGGTGAMLSSDNVWIISRSQDKDADGLNGYNFTINIEKSRYVKEKSKIPINVKFEGGISRTTGLLDIALELGFVQKPSNGWYSRVLDGGEIEQKKFRAKDTENKEFWQPILNNKEFRDAVEKHFVVSNGSLLSDEQDTENAEDTE